jgi:hypothetical protein
MSPTIPASFCPEALRTVGHDLELRGIKTFAVVCEPDLLVVHAGYQSPPAVTPLILHYALRDIQELNRKSQERNDHLSAAKNPLGLSQLLWAIATYVNASGSRLLSVSNTVSTETMPIVKMEYETVQHHQIVDYLKGSAIYELYINVYKLRGTSTLNDSRYTRFSSLDEIN